MASDWWHRPIVFPWERLQTPRVRYALLAALLAAYLIYAGLQAAGWGLGFRACPWWHISGEPCPLCGLTTSFGAMLRGNWGLAAQHHPVGPYLFLLTVAAIVGLTIAFAMTFRAKKQAPSVG